ncbi:MAG TPA: S8 family serine peptidase [Gaiellaceae bacterium]|nr:S8 family serine peptidase [Gaiellaceae bacterium]
MRARPHSVAFVSLAALLLALPAAARSPATTRPAVALAGHDIVVLRTPSLAQRIASNGPATEEQERAWTLQASAAQQQVLTKVAQAGIEVEPDYSYTRVLDGFSARLDPRAVALLQHEPEVAGIFPVRAAYPASMSTGANGNRPLSLPAATGRGVTIALLDTGVDLTSTYLRGHVQPGTDVVNGNDDAHAVADPQNHTRSEGHGTELAGILAAVAPEAKVLPIRVAGWQSAIGGGDAVYARSDQLVEGLELAVDPNQDGDAHDAARVALIGVEEPYASFADAPEAQAAQGAVDLGTVVVTPAGDEGAAGPAYGSIAGPAGAVAVAAMDARSEVAAARVVLRTGLDVVYDRVQPLLDAQLPARSHVLTIATGKFFAHGISRVAGRAAIAPEGANPAATAEAAAAAGATAVLLYGDPVPAGSIDVDVPVALIPDAAVRALLSARAAGHDVAVAIGKGRLAPNTTEGFVAPFSSRGLAFDGSLKPDVSAPGVNVATVGTAISGTSAAAANVAGVAALIAQMRPDLDARALRSLLVGYAQAGGATATQAGAGTFRAGAAAVGELAADATTIGFGVLTGSATRTITLRNVSSRRLHVDVQAVTTFGETAPLQFSVVPESLTLAPGASETVGVTVSTRVRQPSQLALGAIEARVADSETLRIPWALLLHAPAAPPVHASLDKTSFAPSDVNPAVLTVHAGAVKDEQVEPVSQLSVLLYTAAGRYLGVLAQQRDLLPGTYVFGITGRGPSGAVLPRGRYELRVATRPAARATVSFTVS